jgi:hypothetical protein
MDTNGAYEQEVPAQCLHAEIVYDLFHVLARCRRQVIDRLRANEANRPKGDRKARKAVKSARWLLLRNEENVGREEDRVGLAELPEANRTLAKVYLLKDELRHLWDYRHAEYARKLWDHWCSRAIRSRIEPLKTFARNPSKVPARFPGTLPVETPNQSARRDQQQDQGSQLHGPRVPQRRVLPPQDTPGIPHCWAMGQTKRATRDL